MRKARALVIAALVLAAGQAAAWSNHALGTWPALATPEADSLAETDAVYQTWLSALIEAGASAAKPLISRELAESEKDLAAAN